MTDMDDADLDRHFTAARARPPEPDAAFMARAMADALAHQPPAPAPAPSAAPVRRRWSAVFAWLAAAAMPAGLVTATLVGVWIGISAGDEVSQQAAVLMETDLGLELIYRFPAFGGFLEEI